MSVLKKRVGYFSTVLALGYCAGAPAQTVESVSGTVLGTGTAYIDGATFRDKAVTYTNIGGRAIVEGDIDIGAVSNLKTSPSSPSKAITISGARFRWPDAVIPVAIDPSVDAVAGMRDRILAALSHWEAQTHIRFRRLWSEPANTALPTDRVLFVAGEGCLSMVGRRGGLQRITLQATCEFGNVVHEIGHAAGLWHEHSREDRDRFVRINVENILPDQVRHFDPRISDGDDVGAYDYGSIMHYPRWAFQRAAGLVTVQPINADGSNNNIVVIGQRNGLSVADVTAIQAIYPPAAPVAAFRVNPPTVKIGSAATFDGGMSYDPQGNALQYLWDFGDGVQAVRTVPTITHSYAKMGSYTARLIVNDGQMDSAPATVPVSAYDPAVIAVVVNSLLL